MDGKTNRNVNAAVTVQKSAHRILLYGFAEEELPLSAPPNGPFLLVHSGVLEPAAIQLSRKAQPGSRDHHTSPGVINLSPLICLLSHRPWSHSSCLSVLRPIILSLFFSPFPPSASVKRGRVSGSDTSLLTTALRVCVTAWCLGTPTTSPGSSSPSGLWGGRPGCEPSTLTSVSPSAVDT